MNYTRNLGLLFYLTIMLGLAASQAEAADQPRIIWNTSLVECTIGSAQGPIEDVLVTVMATKTLSNIKFRADHGLKDFVKMIPNHFDTMEQGVQYEMRLCFSVAPGAVEGIYTGMVQPWRGQSHGSVASALPVEISLDYGDVVIPPSTKALSSRGADILRSIEVTPDGHQLNFSAYSDEIAGINSDDVLVLNVCSAAPLGFIGRVIEVEQVPGGAKVYTGPATIEDAISEGTIQVSKTLGPGDVVGALENHGIDQGMIDFYLNGLVVYDKDHNPATTHDQVVADGQLSLGTSFDFILGLDESGINYVRSVVTTDEVAQVTFSVKIDLYSVEKEKLIGSPTYFNPIVVWAGFVPVVFAPQLRAYAEFKGSAEAAVETKIIQDASLSYGLQYDHGDWSPVAETTFNLNWILPQVTLGCSAKGSVGPQFTLLLYGVVGPYFDATGFVELQAEALPSLSWELYGGIEAGAGVRIDVLGQTLEDHEFPAVIGIREKLAESETNPGFIAGQVTDAVTSNPIADVLISIYNEIGDLITTGYTNPDGTYTIAVAPETYWITYVKTGYLTAYYYGVDVVEDETVYLEPVLQIDEAYIGDGDIYGYIYNALSGYGVPDITVDLREGINAITGPVVATTVSAGAGDYDFLDLEAGNYTAEIGGTGYETTYFGVVSIGGETTGPQDAVISPILPEGEVRIVLTWGPTPSDLDSHTTGPLPGGSRFHMFYWYAGGNSPWPDYVILDLDDVSSYGPETTTLLQQIPGVYRFTVHDYTNRYSSYSTQLSSSGATVRVYDDNGLVAAFPVPTGQDGTLWVVFEMENGVITPVNTLSYESDPSSIRSEIDWYALPPKETLTPIRK